MSEAARRVIVYAPSGEIRGLAELSVELARRLSASITIAGSGAEARSIGGVGVARAVERSGLEPPEIISLVGDDAARLLTELVMEGRDDVVVTRSADESVVRELLRCCPCTVWIVR